MPEQKSTHTVASEKVTESKTTGPAKPASASPPVHDPKTEGKPQQVKPDGR